MLQQLEQCYPQINLASELLIRTLKKGGKILLCGNGGSAAHCQHIATELMVRYQKNRQAIPAIALSTDSSILTAHSNDFGFSTVFSRQIEALGDPKDCLIAISTSGNSENILHAAAAARAKDMSVIGLMGANGGRLCELATQAIGVPSLVTARIQEAHLLIGHVWCEAIEEAFSSHE